MRIPETAEPSHLAQVQPCLRLLLRAQFDGTTRMSAPPLRCSATKGIVMNWWVTVGDRDPVGPASTELMLERIEAGEVPKDALICEVGGTSWRRIGDVAEFIAALDEDQRHRFDPENEQTPLDPVALNEFVNRPDGATERPTGERSPLRPSEAAPRAWADRFDDEEENTLVDSVPLRASEPPTEP